MSTRINRLSAARLTPVGRGAVATIRVCGPFELLASAGANLPVANSLNSLFHAANGLTLLEQPLKKISFGTWGLEQGEELVVCRLARDVLEIHCHGGQAAVLRVLDDLKQAGCEIVEWPGQQSEGEDDLSVEFHQVLSQTSTWRTTQLVLAQTNGLLRTAFEQLRQSSGTDDGLINELLRWSDFGIHLTKPWLIVLTGRPNVGKSSLINALLGYQRAIVFDQPGTTRDVVTAETAFDGWPVVLADTAGIRESDEQLEVAGIRMAHERIRQADLRIVLVDQNQQPMADDHRLISEWPDAIVVAHKSDLTDYWNNDLPKGAIRVSSVTGSGIDQLQREIVKQLIPEIPPANAVIPLTARQVDVLTRIRSAETLQQRRDMVDRLFVTERDR